MRSNPLPRREISKRARALENFRSRWGGSDGGMQIQSYGDDRHNHQPSSGVLQDPRHHSGSRASSSSRAKAPENPTTADRKRYEEKRSGLEAHVVTQGRTQISKNGGSFLSHKVLTCRFQAKGLGRRVNEEINRGDQSYGARQRPPRKRLLGKRTSMCGRGPAKLDDHDQPPDRPVVTSECHSVARLQIQSSALTDREDSNRSPAITDWESSNPSSTVTRGLLPLLGNNRTRREFFVRPLSQPSWGKRYSGKAQYLLINETEPCACKIIQELISQRVLWLTCAQRNSKGPAPNLAH
ncbi:hypothetical protein U1Q18_036709 [Sarracenia purpurea var. burkii]